MIRARKGGPLQWVGDHYLDGLFRRRFRAMWVRGELPPPESPLLVYANHSSWWDGFLAHQLCRSARRDVYCLVEENTLRRWPFFSRLGAFSIRRGDPWSSIETLRYARSLFTRPDAAVFIFPEGALRPFGLVGRLERGAALLARITGATCVPVAFRCAMFEGERPDALVEIGPPHGALSTAAFEDRLAAAVQRVATARSVAEFARVGATVTRSKQAGNSSRREAWG